MKPLLLNEQLGAQLPITFGVLQAAEGAQWTRTPDPETSQMPALKHARTWGSRQVAEGLTAARGSDLAEVAAALEARVGLPTARRSHALWQRMRGDVGEREAVAKCAAAIEGQLPASLVDNLRRRGVHSSEVRVIFRSCSCSAAAAGARPRCVRSCCVFVPFVLWPFLCQLWGFAHGLARLVLRGHAQSAHPSNEGARDRGQAWFLSL